jgi:hypothetical protein
MVIPLYVMKSCTGPDRSEGKRVDTIDRVERQILYLFISISQYLKKLYKNHFGKY